VTSKLLPSLILNLSASLRSTLTHRHSLDLYVLHNRHLSPMRLPLPSLKPAQKRQRTKFASSSYKHTLPSRSAFGWSQFSTNLELACLRCSCDIIHPPYAAFGSVWRLVEVNECDESVFGLYLVCLSLVSLSLLSPHLCSSLSCMRFVIYVMGCVFGSQEWFS